MFVVALTPAQRLRDFYRCGGAQPIRDDLEPARIPFTADGLNIDEITVSDTRGAIASSDRGVRV